jgi:GT2 family glycosyltransferase
MAMVLMKYTGKDKYLLQVHGVDRWIMPDSIFSGDEYLLKIDGFVPLNITPPKEKVSNPNNLRLDAIAVGDKQYEPMFNTAFLQNNPKPKVSICIVTKDGFGIIDQCLQSIHNNVKYSNTEVLICDTGTTDKRVIDIYTYLGRTANPEKLKIFGGQQYNFSKNNNFLASKATGDVLLFMNNDVFLTYDAVSEMVKYILCSNMGCLGHRLVWRDKPTLIQHDGQVLYKPDGTWYGPGHHNYQANINSVSNKNATVEGVTAAFLMMRKNLFDEVGGFNEDYKDIFQDVDLNLKVSKKGYINFCIREKALIHVDHATRVGDSTPDSPKDMARFHVDWRLKPFEIPKKIKHSILVCATKEDQMQRLKDSIKSKVPYEMVFVNNRANYMSSAEALNVLMEVAQGELLFLSHQDVTFEEDELFVTVEKRIKELGGSFGVLGIAGVKYSSYQVISGVNFSDKKYDFNYVDMQTVDEFLMIVRKSSGLTFDEVTFNHFHFYGADICCLAMTKSLRNYLIKVKCTHHSGGGDNLKTGNGYLDFMDQGHRFYMKWGKIFPFIATTTTNFTPERIHYYIAEVIGMEPKYKYLPKDIVV